MWWTCCGALLEWQERAAVFCGDLPALGDKCHSRQRIGPSRVLLQLCLLCVSSSSRVFLPHYSLPPPICPSSFDYHYLPPRLIWELHSRHGLLHPDSLPLLPPPLHQCCNSITYRTSSSTLLSSCTRRVPPSRVACPASVEDALPHHPPILPSPRLDKLWKPFGPRACSFEGFYMATVSLSPSPISVSAVMSSRRGPLASNPNVANSPLRGASTLSGYPKQKRSYATVQREDAYGQPPPVKKQALENGAQRPVRSPSKLARPATTVQRAASRLPTRGPASKSQSTSRSAQEADNIEAWKKHHRLKFPQMIFYFESIPDDLRAKLTKKIAYLGAVCILFEATRVPGLMFCSAKNLSSQSRSRTL